MNEDPIEVRETYLYTWTCSACSEEAHVRTPIPKLFLQCPICGLILQRDHVSHSKWRIPARRDRQLPDQEPIELTLHTAERQGRR